MLNFNKQFEMAFGYSREEVKTLEDWFQLAYPDSDYRKWVIDNCYSEIVRSVETNSDIKPIEYNITCKNGDVRTAIVFGCFVGDDILLTFFDITERKQAEQERLANIHFLNSMDRINRAIQGTNDFDQMMSDVLDEIISIFNCDRAFLINFSGPDFESWTMPIARWRPEYHISYLNKPLPLDSLGQKVIRAMFDSEAPVKAGPNTPFPLTEFVSESFGFKSFMGSALYPKTGNLWELGIHQCSHERVFTTEEERLFKEIAIRVTDALTNLLMHRTLKETEEKERLILESISDTVIVTDDQGNMIYVCPNTENIFRIPQNEVYGLKNIQKLLNGSVCNISDLNEKGEFQNIEWSIKDSFGQTRYLLINAKWVNIDGGSVLFSMRDITEQKKIELSLRESEEKYRSMMESMDEATYICSSDFRIEYMNPAMIRKIGRDATGERCYKVLHGMDEQCPWCEHDKVIKGESIKTELVKPEEDEFFFVSHSPIFHTNGSVSKLSIYRDITEKRKLEYRIQQAQKMEAIGNLAGGIAHDFNNILSSIIGFTELALDETRKGTLLEDSLQEVYSAGKRAKDLVKQILAFARQTDEKLSPIQPRVILKEVLNFIRSTIPTTIEIQENIKSESLILGNSTQVHQVLMNLCTNAAHAMEDTGGTLYLSLKDVFVDKEEVSIDIKPGDYIVIEVSDTGTGIAPEIIDSIFEPYFTTKAPGEGTGIGLAVVQGIVETYGGKINVKSQLGKGTTFTIYLPVTKKRSDSGAYVPEQLPQGTERILFVDDEAPIAKMGSQILKRLGYPVTTRTSSIEALELFQVKPNDFDLVVTDMTMPNLTGDKLAIELMKIRPDIPVILCTGYSKKISDETASEIGIRAFTYKPVVKADLAKTVRKVLDEAKSKSCA